MILVKNPQNRQNLFRIVNLPPIRASVTQSFLLFPPDNLPAFLFTNSLSYIVSKKYSTLSSKSIPESPFILPKRYKCSTGVKCSQRQSN